MCPASFNGKMQEYCAQQASVAQRGCAPRGCAPRGCAPLGLLQGDVVADLFNTDMRSILMVLLAFKGQNAIALYVISETIVPILNVFCWSSGGRDGWVKNKEIMLKWCQIVFIRVQNFINILRIYCEFIANILRIYCEYIANILRIYCEYKNYKNYINNKQLKII